LEELNLPTQSIAPDTAQYTQVPEEGSPRVGASSAAALIAALGFDVVSLDTLQARTGMETALLQAKLLELELDSQVFRLPGGLFQRRANA
jgi:DNA processing protein